MIPVQWGVLSVSGHYRLRVQIPVRESELLTMKAIASRSAEKAAAAAEEFGIEHSFGTYEELLADPDIQAVYIPLPNHMHAQWVRKAADAGKHILCEKPFSLDAAETEAAIAYAEGKGVKVMEAFMYKLHSQWLRAAELVRIGEIGTIHAVNVFFTYNNRDPENIRNRKEAGGGALLDIGCYAVSASRLIMGREPVRAVSLIRNDPAFGTDVLTSALLDFGDARASFTVGTQTFPFQRVEVLGSRGALTVHIPFNMYPDVPARLTVTTGVGTREIEFEPEDQYARLFEEFSIAVAEDLPVPIPSRDAVLNQKVLDAVARSAESGGWETV